jgi:hypothetical protein
MAIPPDLEVEIEVQRQDHCSLNRHTPAISGDPFTMCHLCAMGWLCGSRKLAEIGKGNGLWSEIELRPNVALPCVNFRYSAAEQDH